MMKKYYIIGFMAVLFVVCGQPSFAQSWKSSPLNAQNSDQNPDNSPHNHKNSPYNIDNSHLNTKSKNIARDNDGNATGYTVKKENGGSNQFDTNGKRTGYNYSNDDEQSD